MVYVYLLRSKKTGELYVGSTRNLKERFYQHNNGRGHSTRHGIPWEVIYYEAYGAESDAHKRESQLKRHAQAMTHLKRRLHHTLQKKSK